MFLRAKPKDRRRKKRCDVTRHPGLELLGFQHRSSPLLAYHSIQIAALCPSFDTATNVLRDLGIFMNHRLLQYLCYDVADQVLANRCDNVIDDFWKRSGLRLLVCIDGGRLRERKKRRGRKKKGAKRQGYSTDWTAPYLITITCIDEEGKHRRDVPPIYDGTVNDINKAFELLSDYLKRINTREAVDITFCADGGSGIWERFDMLADRLQQTPVNRVLDYPHAKQSLKDIIDLIHQGSGMFNYEYEQVTEQLKSLLWQGKIDDIETIIHQRLFRKRQKKAALKKLHHYFGDSAKFQYQRYRATKIPIGSGTAESAIRHVINLRLKSSGQFWKSKNTERMIFLRSQVISCRWHSVLNADLQREGNILCYNELESIKKAA